MPGLAPGIHDFIQPCPAEQKTWITGSSPVMTEIGGRADEKSLPEIRLKLTQGGNPVSSSLMDGDIETFLISWRHKEASEQVKICLTGLKRMPA